MLDKNNYSFGSENIIDSVKAPGKTGLILNVAIHALGWDEIVSTIGAWAKERQSRYVCLCNVHSLMTARSNPAFSQVLEEADLVLPDGMPIAWLLRKQGYNAQERIGGPDLMKKCCEEIESTSDSVFLYGSTANTLENIKLNLKKNHPELKIAGLLSPPFRELDSHEEEAIVKMINDSGANILFVALGCPRQEEWMARQRGKIHAVMIGLGAAFEFYAGTVRRAPLWMQRAGLEWLHRLATEPRRLWKRYLVTNTSFIFALLTRSIKK